MPASSGAGMAAAAPFSAVEDGRLPNPSEDARLVNRRGRSGAAPSAIDTAAWLMAYVDPSCDDCAPLESLPLCVSECHASEWRCSAAALGSEVPGVPTAAYDGETTSCPWLFARRTIRVLSPSLPAWRVSCELRCPAGLGRDGGGVRDRRCLGRSGSGFSTSMRGTAECTCL